MPHQHARSNRLAQSTSPYLLQHAHNPVDWHPWGQEAFDEARRRDVPIFLSVGYSTCYWCHVMERESFEDEHTARVLNDNFLPVKVDREERPDVDDLYMAAVQAFTGRGGWPMSVFLEPRSLKPFWGGTYFPPDPRHGLPSFRQALEGIAKAWKEQRDGVHQQAEALAGAVAEHFRPAAAPAPRPLGRDQVAAAVTTLLRIHDRTYGGFGQGGPKFPQPSYIDLLLQFRQVAGDDQTRLAVDSAVRLTLDRMATGGMNDQVGGGFHRYSVDERWVVPHFEKMLYDNGQLAETYAVAAVVYDDDFYRRTVRRTLEYVLREMTSPDGAFFSAQDAEVNHREGQNYLWTRQQFEQVLGKDEAAFAARIHGLNEGPNFRDPHHPDDPPANVLVLEGRPEALAGRVGLSEQDLLARLDGMNDRLYAARQKRDQPLRDDKVLAAWNGMMIAGMAVGGTVLGEAKYVQAARRAADFILARMRAPDGMLLRTLRSTEAGERAHTPGFLDDYAWVMHGLIQLHRAVQGDTGQYLDAALELLHQAEKHFGDPATGGYFDTLADQPDLFIRGRSTYDGAIPSGVSAMLHNLVDLWELTRDQRHLDRAAAGLQAISPAIAESPVATVNSTRALLRLLLTPEGESRISAMAAAAHAPAQTADLPPPPRPETARDEPAQPIEVYASTDRLAIKPGEPAGFVMQIIIHEGLHIAAADPGPAGEGLTGVHLDVISGAGVSVYADWPQGEPYGEAGELRVYRGTIDVPVILERDGDWTGRPILALRYQACTETECLAPGAVELALALDKG